MVKSFSVSTSVSNFPGPPLLPATHMPTAWVCMPTAWVCMPTAWVCIAGTADGGCPLRFAPHPAGMLREGRFAGKGPGVGSTPGTSGPLGTSGTSGSSGTSGPSDTFPGDYPSIRLFDYSPFLYFQISIHHSSFTILHSPFLYSSFACASAASTNSCKSLYIARHCSRVTFSGSGS